MTVVKTQHPIAVDSLDHKYPEGVYFDNNVSTRFVEELEAYFGNRKINFLDLGCAGGALAIFMHERGHKSIGIDGSDGCLNVKQEVINQYGGIPYGHYNWVKYVNEVLHTADVTKDYDIVDDNELVRFDAITCWDVMEHFEPDTVDNFLRQVYKHLKDDGVFMASIAMFPSGAHKEWADQPNIQYHKSLFKKDWWMEKLTKYFTVERFPLSVCNREYINIATVDYPGSEYLIFVAHKIK
jgi:2-polyprenyl-3-methyl-5-hydroxy-6-metoxy-1,4-benzoquinol methylase